MQVDDGLTASAPYGGSSPSAPRSGRSSALLRTSGTVLAEAARAARRPCVGGGCAEAESSGRRAVCSPGSTCVVLKDTSDGSAG